MKSLFIIVLVLASFLIGNELLAESVKPEEIADKAKAQAGQVGVEVGMTYSEVVKVLGSSGIKQEMAGTSQEESVYSWQIGEKESVIVTFRADRVIGASYLLKQQK